MNSQSIWSGHEYAYYQNRPKGVTFSRHGVQKVKALKVTKVRLSGNTRYTSMVLAEFPDGSERNIKARDILSFWDDYEDQLHVVMQREAEQEAEREAMKVAKLARENKCIALLEQLGFHRHDITVSYGVQTASISVNRIIEVLEANA